MTTAVVECSICRAEKQERNGFAICRYCDLGLCLYCDNVAPINYLKKAECDRCGRKHPKSK